jgi:predicted GNAT family acetyltransferase
MSDADSDRVPIENNVAAHRFEARFPEGLAMLKYHYDREGRLNLDHTEVPPALQHQGVAGLLARTALDFARARNLTVVPVCPYVIAFLQKHPELESVVDRGRSS